MNHGRERPSAVRADDPVLSGSTAIATLHAPVPGPIKLVDHALSRVARKGALAVIYVQGPEDPGIYDGTVEA